MKSVYVRGGSVTLNCSVLMYLVCFGEVRINALNLGLWGFFYCWGPGIHMPDVDLAWILRRLSASYW
jgi:hypothetical protein